MQRISRLGSRPARLLESHQPSPGEIRKLLIALGIRRHPWMIVMDEPTNHLDLQSIECDGGGLLFESGKIDARRDAWPTGAFFLIPRELRSTLRVSVISRF